MKNIPVTIWKGFWTRQTAIDNPDKLFLFGDNLVDLRYKHVPKSTQAVIRGLNNAVGIITKINRETYSYSYLNNEHYEWFEKHLIFIKDKLIKKCIQQDIKCVIISEDGIGTGKAMLKQKAPLLFEHLTNWLNDLQENGLEIK